MAYFQWVHFGIYKTLARESMVYAAQVSTESPMEVITEECSKKKDKN